MIAVGLKDKPGADVDIEGIFLSDGADGAIRKLVVDAFIDAGISLHSTKRSSRIPNAFDQEEAAPA